MAIRSLAVQVSSDDLRSLRALDVLTTSGTWVQGRTRDGRKFYVVPGSRGHVYWTNCQACTCPDAARNVGACKHQLAVRLHVARVKAQQAARDRKPKGHAPKAQTARPLAGSPLLEGCADCGHWRISHDPHCAAADCRCPSFRSPAMARRVAAMLAGQP